MTVSISLSATGSAAIRQCCTASSTSPTISRSPCSSASGSSVTVTEPSSEFSIGASAHCTSRLRTAITVS